MSESKPYDAPDFQAELAQDERSVARLKFMLSQAAEQQKHVRKRYDDQIKKIKSDHKMELEKVREKSFAEGEKTGLDEGHESVSKALEDLEIFTNKLIENEKNFIRNAEKHVVTLAIAVARRILGREVRSDQDIVIYSVREALRQVADKASILIKVNPEDFQNIIAHRRELQQMDKNFSELDFLEDEKISTGGCVVQTRSGMIDGRLDSQLEEIERNFTRNL